MASECGDEDDAEPDDEGEIGINATTPKGADFLVCYPTAEGKCASSKYYNL